MGISSQEALDLFNSDDLIGIGMAANEVRRKKTDPRVATYQIDRNINYTNFCTEYCSFCAFYRPLGAKDGYILPLESIYEKIEEMLRARRHGRPAAGRPAPGPANRILREHAALDSRAISAGSPALLFRAGNHLHRGSLRALNSRNHRAPARRWTHFHSRRRRGNSGRRSPRTNRSPEVQVRRMGNGAPRGAQAWHAHHGDDDVRLRRGVPPPRESLRKDPPDSGRVGRLHRVHSVDFRARKYAARERKCRKRPRSIT